MKIAVILNPKSGNRDVKRLKEELLQKCDNCNLEIWETEQERHAEELGQKAVKEGFDTVIAVGGDGTIIEVISGIIDSPVKLGIIPYGTGNMLASNLGIPVNNISKAIDIILKGHSQKIDLGKINDRYFAFMAGCGFDAKIIEEVSREKKRKLGMLAYFLEGFWQIFRTKYPTFKIRLNNRKTIKTKALTVIVANSGNIVGNLFSLAPEASLNDGLLDLIIISPRYTVECLPILWEIITRQPRRPTSKIMHYQARMIEIKSKPNIPVQADGDIIGRTPVKISILPQSAEIITPVIENKQIEKSNPEHLKNIFNTILNR